MAGSTEIDPEAVAIMATAIATEGYTFKDFTDLTDEQMEAGYAVAFGLIEQGRAEEAEALLVWMCGMDQYQPKYLIALGYARQQQRKYRSAVEAFGAAGLLEVANPVPALRAAECLLALGDTEPARSALRAALHWSGKDPRHAWIRERAGLLMAGLDRHKGKPA